MEDFVIQTLLYDFYGELLTEHQRRVYQDIKFDDLSASEVAREAGISRQGVHDMIHRCDRILQEYESKLHLVERFLHIRESIGEIHKLSDACLEDSQDSRIQEIKEISSKILEEL